MKALFVQRLVLVCFSVICLLTWSLVWAAPGLVESETISALQNLKSEGKLTVRALRAWNQLPDRFMALAFELRSLDIDLMSADAQKVRELASKADGNEQLRPLTDDLQALAEYMAEFGPQEPDTGSTGQQSARVETELEQEALAQKLFTRIGTLKDYDLEGMEEMYLQVIAQAPETRLVHELSICDCEKNSDGPPENHSEENTPGLRKDFDRFYHAWAFREIAVRNYADALKIFATQKTRKKFAVLNDDLWPATDPALGWAFFFDGAVLCPAGGSDKNGPVAFYHCFADVFLVLTFGTGEDVQTVVTDAHVLTGDFVRNKGKASFKAERHWTGKEVYAPYAVGLSAAETIKAFEGLFPDGEDFRAAFNKLVSAKAREANQISAGKQFMETLADLAGLLSPDKATDTCSSARKKLVEINDRVMAGQMKRILKEADKTPAEHSKELKDHDIAAWRNYKTAAYVESGDYGLVMLQSSANPDTYLSLLMKKQGKDMRLSRMDFLSFDRFYEHGESLAREVK